jgi:hypothetical protein
MWKEMTVAYFTRLFQQLPEGAEKQHDKTQDDWFLSSDSDLRPLKYKVGTLSFDCDNPYMSHSSE